MLNRHNNNGSRYKFRFRKNSKSKLVMEQGSSGAMTSGGDFMMNDPKSTSTVASDLSRFVYQRLKILFSF